MAKKKLENFFYELALFLTSNLSDKEAEEKFNNLIKEIENLGGSIKETNLPRLQPLAYEIKKENSGYFCTVSFKLDPEKIEELNKILKLDTLILRYLIVKKIEKTKPQPSLRHIPSKETFSKAEEKEISQEVSLEELDRKLDELLKE